MRLNKIRRFSSIFFGVISVLIVSFYSNPEFLTNYQSYKGHQFFLVSDSGNPIVYYKASENLSYTHSLPKVQAVGHHELDFTFDSPSLEIATSEALFVVASLRNVFYVFTSINAP